MGLVKVKVTRMYFDGEKRVREGAILHLDEKQVNGSCHELLDKSSKDKKVEKKEKKAIPGQGPLPKAKVLKEPSEDIDQEIAEEDTPI